MRIKLAIAVSVSALAGAALMTMPVAHAATTTQEEGLKQKACAFIGCPGGPQACADVEAGVSIPGIGHVDVTYHCYEQE